MFSFELKYGITEKLISLFCFLVKQGHYLNGRPMPCDEIASYGVTRVPDARSSPFKGNFLAINTCVI